MTPELVRSIREGLGISQRRLSRALGLSSATVGQWERGRAGMSGPAEQLLLLLAERPDVLPVLLDEDGGAL